MPDLPEFIGPYKILKKLGEGGFATVYLAQAHDPDDTPPVALKALTSPESYARFQREIETVAKLEHPNIIRIFDTGEVEKIVLPTGQTTEGSEPSETSQRRSRLSKLWSGLTGRSTKEELDSNNTATLSAQSEALVPYFTMEFIAGGTLRDRLEAESYLSRAEAVPLVRQVAAALSYAHKQGVIHRDVNPNNILLDTSKTPARPVLTDFGLVKPFGTDDNLTVTVGLIGTFHYYAPEQWNRETLTPATDLYALAITLFEMLAGQRPFKGDIFSLRDKHLNEPLPPLSNVTSRIGPFFDDILATATAKNPLDRYESIAQFITALEAANKEVDYDDAYKEIRKLMKDQAHVKALNRLDQVFIREKKYEYRDVAKLFWGLVYAKQHEGVLPPEWNGIADLRTKPMPDPSPAIVEPQAEPQMQRFKKWHEINRYVIPLTLALTMLIGGIIASQIPASLKAPALQIVSLLLLVAYLVYYAWVYYIRKGQ